MFALRIVSILAAVTMTVAVALGFLSGDFMDEGSAIWSLSWGKVTLVDLYVGLVLFGFWVAARERRLSAVVLWWVGLVVLGNLAAALYMVFASFTASSIDELLTGVRVRPDHAVLPETEVGP